MRALVIGGTGPTGPYIVNGLLKRGYEVTILHRGIHEVQFEGPVRHLHGDPHFMETLQDSLGQSTYDVAVSTYGRLRHVAQAVKGHTSKFIAIGGLPYLSLVRGLHDPMGTPVPLRETDPLCDEVELNKFTYLMALSEQTTMEAHHRGDYSATIFRYPMVYGPRQLRCREWSLIRRFLDKRRQVIIPNEGLTLVSRGYAVNMAHAVLLAIDHSEKCSGEIYNVADERVLSVREWVVQVGRALNFEWELISMPGDLARPTRPYAGRDHHQVLDITKIRAQLGYRDVVPVEDAILRTVEFYLQNRPEPGGELEKQLGDPFDYDTENRLIEEYRKVIGSIRNMANVGYEWRHPYDHPKKLSE